MHDGCAEEHTREAVSAKVVLVKCVRVKAVCKKSICMRSMRVKDTPHRRSTRRMDLFHRTRKRAADERGEGLQKGRPCLHQRRRQAPERQKRHREVRRQDGKAVRQLSVISFQPSDFSRSFRGSRSQHFGATGEPLLFLSTCRVIELLLNNSTSHSNLVSSCRLIAPQIRCGALAPIKDETPSMPDPTRRPEPPRLYRWMVLLFVSLAMGWQLLHL